MTKPIVVVLTKPVGTFPVGTELGFDSVRTATRQLGDGTYRVARYQNGEPYTEPSSKSDRPSPESKSDDSRKATS